MPKVTQRGESEPGFEPGFSPPERSPSPVSAGVGRREASAGPSTVCTSCSKGWRWSDGGEGPSLVVGLAGASPRRSEWEGWGRERGIPGGPQGPLSGTFGLREKAVTLGPLGPPAHSRLTGTELTQKHQQGQTPRASHPCPHLCPDPRLCWFLGVHIPRPQHRVGFDIQWSLQGAGSSLVGKPALQGLGTEHVCNWASATQL